MSAEVVKKEDTKTGSQGQKFLVEGEKVALRHWEESPNEKCESKASPYETVGVLISGQLVVEVEGKSNTISAGDSWHVPANAKHSYLVKKAIVAIEATSPPARTTS